MNIPLDQYGYSADCFAIACRVTDALNQAICQRTPSEADGLIHHSDRGSQYLSIKYTERLTDAGMDPSVGSVGDSYDNALAESIIGLFKTEVINFLGPWKSIGQGPHSSILSRTRDNKSGTPPRN